MSYSISDGQEITYGKLQELGTPGIVKQMKEWFPQASDREMNELLGYIDEFMDDVEGNIE
jgi:hypothetical protein